MEVAPMKRILLLAAIFIAGCTSQQSDQLTQQQKDQIKSEVKVVYDSIMAAHERLDFSRMLQYFVDSPEFAIYFADGSRMDFQTFKKSALEEMNAIADLKVTMDPEKYTVLTKDHVIYSFVDRGYVSFKSGDKMTVDPGAYTWIFRKIDGQWKLIYSHESGIFTMQKAGKK
jgi:hypothetical protein